MAAFKTLTVRALRELLENEDDDALVVFTTNYGDYHRTAQALTLDGEIEEGIAVKSAYSNSGYALADDDEDQDDEDAQKVLVIR